jgi:uncharacterized membrane protein YcfT
MRLTRSEVDHLNDSAGAAKEALRISKPHGVLICVNDGLTELAPDIVYALVCDALVHSYFLIDCFLYVTVNRYVEVAHYNEPKLVWNPS